MVVFLAEVFSLTIRFDSQVFSNQPDLWFAPWLDATGRVGPYLVTSIAAMILLGGRSLRRQLAEILARRSRERWLVASLLGLAAQGLSFLGFSALTMALFQDPSALGATANLIAGGWLAAGLATLGFWLLALLPAREWWSLIVRFRGPLVGGLALGAVATWASQGLAIGLWNDRLGWLTLHTVQGALGWLLQDPLFDPARRLVGTREFWVTIAPECSGFEGIGLIWAFLGAYLWFGRRSVRFPRALVLLPLATLLIWSLNTIRIVALVCLGCWGYRDIALGGFHSQAGWLAFNGVALGTVWASMALPWFRADADARPQAMNPATPYLVPFLVLVLATMITTALSADGFDRLYPARVLAVGLAVWCCRRADVGLRRTWSWEAVGLGVLVFVVWMALEPLAPSGDGSAIAAGLAGLPRGLAATWLVFRTVGSVVTVPLAEELAFRGFLTRRLIAADFATISPRRFTIASFVVSSLLFGALHGRWLAGTLAGMLYALALYRRGELTDAVLAHAVSNALIALTVLAGGTWSLWS